MDVPPMKQEVPQQMPIKQESDWVVSPQERKLYLDIFRQNDDDGDGFINGAQARNLFSSSGLPLTLLGQIWYVVNAAQYYALHYQIALRSEYICTFPTLYIPTLTSVIIF
jgi:hypothetical protein